MVEESIDGTCSGNDISGNALLRVSGVRTAKQIEVKKRGIYG
jgi:hypothetical protein